MSETIESTKLFLVDDGPPFHCEECGEEMFYRLTHERYICTRCGARYTAEPKLDELGLPE